MNKHTRMNCSQTLKRKFTEHLTRGHLFLLCDNLERNPGPWKPREKKNVYRSFSKTTAKVLSENEDLINDHCVGQNTNNNFLETWSTENDDDRL